VAGVVTGLQAGRPGVRIPSGAKDFVVYQPSKPAVASSQTFNSMGTGVVYPGVKRPGRDVDHSPPFSVPWLTMSGTVSLLPLYVLMWRTRTAVH
jgi:hypothetical protein